MSKNPCDQITLEEVKVEQDRCFKRFIKGQIWGYTGNQDGPDVNVDPNHYEDAGKEVDEGCVVHLVS